MSTETIASRLAEDAREGVQRVSVDGVSVELMSVDDRIKAAEYAARERATAKNHMGLRFVKLVPPGST